MSTIVNINKKTLTLSNKKKILSLIDSILNFLKGKNENSLLQNSFFTMKAINGENFKILCNSNHLIIKSKLTTSDVQLLFILFRCLIDNNFIIFSEYELSKDLIEHYGKENNLSNEEIDEIFVKLIGYSDVKLWVKYLKSFHVDITQYYEDAPSINDENNPEEKCIGDIATKVYDKIKYFLFDTRKVFESVTFGNETYMKTTVTYKEDTMRFKKGSFYDMYLYLCGDGKFKILTFLNSEEYDIGKESMVTYDDSLNFVPHISAENISVFLEKYNGGSNIIDKDKEEFFTSYEVLLNDWLDGVYFLHYYPSSNDCGSTILEMNVSKFLSKYSYGIDPSIIKIIPKSLLEKTIFNE